ncbi:hypothetical protein AKJ51_02220 [candidate division MSBL1 archaeon SCGC-AAA382A20]|uniref:Uncharacterized protein n=1 Tax=candidate division MSBL1 archaeon SCGC-AAA382A20 TaxID=1698280 RepID=A0A133VKS5_9EURY|nr:hypothetical protein AKJ51_02220 [candidate division MSBL1 archaeon SCGC-AAA382A20]
MKGIGTILSVAVLFFLFISDYALAHCPVCTLAVGTGVAAARFYGVDSTIIGVWLGAFIISTGLWLTNLLRSRNLLPNSYTDLQNFLISFLVFLSFAIPFYVSGLIGNPKYTVWGMDKLLLGMVVGSSLSYLGPEISAWIKRRNGDNVVLPFQGAVIVLILLSLSSGTFLVIL